MHRLVCRIAAMIAFAALALGDALASNDPVQADPNTGASFNRYNYANNNPYKFIDPDGRQVYPTTPPPVTSPEAVGMIVDFIPGIGDGKGVFEAIIDPTVPNIAAAGVGFVPIVGDAGGKAIKQGGKIAENAAKGRAVEKAVVAEMGDQVAGTRVTLEASTGQRSVADIVTTGKGIAEVKSGGARLSPGQKAVKADVDAGRAVTPRGQNAANAGLEPGKPVQMKSYDEIRRP